MLTWEDFVRAFIASWRNEAAAVSERERAFLRREERLPAPCQVEVVEFSDPFRLALLFFFEQAKPDLEISFHEIGWDEQRAFGAELVAEYEVRLDPLLRIFQGCRNMDPATIYAIDGFENVLMLGFPHDVRLGIWALAKTVEGNSAKAVAKDLFCLNLGQAQDYY
jgi:hypothetical protein